MNSELQHLRYKLARAGLFVTLLLYVVLTLFLFLTTTARAQKKIIIPADMGTLYYRVEQLEKKSNERDGENLSQRVAVLEQISKLDRDNRALLWGLIGTAGLNILGTAFLGFITTRKRQS